MHKPKNKQTNRKMLRKQDNNMPLCVNQFDLLEYRGRGKFLKGT